MSAQPALTFDSVELDGWGLRLRVSARRSVDGGPFETEQRWAAARVVESFPFDDRSLARLRAYWLTHGGRATPSMAELRRSVAGAVQKGQFSASFTVASEVRMPLLAGVPAALPPAETAQGKSGVDIDKAAEYVTKHVSKKEFGEGHCAAFVRRALNYAGGKVEGVASAKDFGPQLVTAGFVEAKVEATYPDDKSQQKKGDVVVIQPYSGNTDGHMTMFNGTNWVSDFVQRDMWGGQSARKDKPTFNVYRP